MDGPAGAAAVAGPADADDPQARRDVVEHLARHLADQVQRAATAGAGLMLDIEPDVLAGQVRRQARPIVLGVGCTGLSLGKRKVGFDARNIGVEVLEAKLQLIVIEPLGAPAELAALELFDNEIEPLDLGVRLTQTGALGRERAHQLLQRLHIIRQCGEIDVHKRRV